MARQASRTVGRGNARRVGFSFARAAQIYLRRARCSPDSTPRMATLAELTAKLTAGHELSTIEVESAAAALAAPEGGDEAKAALLSALAAKGETAGEVAAFAAAFRARAIDPGVEAWAARAID